MQGPKWRQGTRGRVQTRLERYRIKRQQETSEQRENMEFKPGKKELNLNLG